jgi:hypothetical protein
MGRYFMTRKDEKIYFGKLLNFIFRNSFENKGLMSRSNFRQNLFPVKTITPDYSVAQLDDNEPLNDFHANKQPVHPVSTSLNLQVSRVEPSA